MALAPPAGGLARGEGLSAQRSKAACPRAAATQGLIPSPRARPSAGGVGERRGGGAYLELLAEDACDTACHTAAGCDTGGL